MITGARWQDTYDAWKLRSDRDDDWWNEEDEKMPDHDEQELNTLIDALRELAGRLDEDADKGLIEEAVKAVEALAELEAEENGEDEPPAAEDDEGENA